MRYAGHSEIPSDGWSKGRLADQQAVTACVRAAVHEAEAQARVSVDTLVVGIGGSGVEGCNARGIYEFGRPRPITIDDMAYAVERSEQVRLEEDRIILHLFPQDFTLDGRAGKRYPRRLHLFAPGGQRSHHYVFGAGTLRDPARRAASVLWRRGIHVRAGGHRLCVGEP